MFAKKITKTNSDSEVSEYSNKVIEVRRVTRVVAGGKRMRFRACVVVGNRNGQIGAGTGKGADVPSAVTKAIALAKKHLITVSIVDGTIPHRIYNKFKAAKLLLKPAPKGRGIIAGGSVRAVLELAGIKNVVGKILGSNNKENNVKAAIIALQKLKPRLRVNKLEE